MTGLLLLLVFLAAAAAMVSGRLPAMLALPLMALGIGLVAGVPFIAGKAPPDLERLAYARFMVTGVFSLLFQEIAAKGVPRLAGAAFTVMLGGVFGKLLEYSGVAPALVRRVAELAGDRAFGLTVSLTLTVSLLFTSLGGLGAVVMVGNIVFPVLLSLGVPPLVTGASFLMGFSLGGLFNLANWKLYTEALQLPATEVAAFAARFGAAYLAVLLAFLVVQLKRAKISVPVASVVQAALAVAGVGFLLVRGASSTEAADVVSLVPVLLGSGLLMLMILPRRRDGPDLPAMLAPAVPLVVVLGMGGKIEAGFVVGILFLLARTPGDRSQLTARCMVEGVQSVAPAVALMMGIGMLLIATFHPSVREVIQPALTALVPSGQIGFVVFFGLAAPLALYRGPLNVWGMGFGVAQILAKSPALTPSQVMVAFLSDGQVQGVCDPTNTHNVWVASQLRIDLDELLRMTLPWVWGIAILGLLIGSAS